MTRAPAWTDAEKALVLANPAMNLDELAAMLPGRSRNATSQLRHRLGGRKLSGELGPAVKAPGEYKAVLADLLVDEPGLLGIWLKWNGYAKSRELNRDGFGWVTLVCTAE
jgi:hypothetical protein